MRLRIEAAEAKLAEAEARNVRLMGKMEIIRDTARTGLPPIGFTEKQWDQQRLISIAGIAARECAAFSKKGEPK